MSIGRQKYRIVFNNDQFAVTTQARSSINNFPITCGHDWRACFTSKVKPFICSPLNGAVTAPAPAKSKAHHLHLQEVFLALIPLLSVLQFLLALRFYSGEHKPHQNKVPTNFGLTLCFHFDLSHRVIALQQPGLQQPA